MTIFVCNFLDVLAGVTRVCLWCATKLQVIAIFYQECKPFPITIMGIGETFSVLCYGTPVPKSLDPDLVGSVDPDPGS